MLTFYDTGAEFRSECSVPWIEKDFVAKGFLDVNIDNLGKGKRDFAVKYTKDGQGILAIRQGNHPMFFKGAEQIVPDFAAALQYIGIAVQGVIAEKRSYELFIKHWKSREVSREDMHCMIRGTSDSGSTPPEGWARAEKKHVKDMTKLLEQFYKDTMQEAPQEDLHDVVQSKLDRSFVMVRDGKPVSMAYRTREVSDAACISGVVTDPKYRGKGCATAMIGHLADLIQREGKQAYLFVNADNMVARKVYNNVGFRTNKFYVKGTIYN